MSTAVDEFFDNHKWLAMSMGEFIQWLVDVGDDDSIIARIVEDEPTDGQAQFARKIEVWVVPNGQVKSKMLDIGCNLTHRVIRKYIKAGLVK